MWESSFWIGKYIVQSTDKTRFNESMDRFPGSHDIIELSKNFQNSYLSACHFALVLQLDKER